MYKAGDFTNGKMNSIFKESFERGSADISHKQFGDFTLVNKDCEIEYLLTPLEIVYGIYRVNVDGVQQLMSVLDGRIEEHKKDNHEILDLDQFEQHNLIDGLLFLLDENNSPKIERNNYVLRTLTNIACKSDSYIITPRFHDADKNKIMSELNKENNNNPKIVKAFLDGDSYKLDSFFIDVFHFVIDYVITNLESFTIDWNEFKYSSVYFNMATRYKMEGDKRELKQEFVSVCMKHLEHLGFIVRNCPDTYRLNEKTIEI